MDVEIFKPEAVHRIRMNDQSKIKARLREWAREYEVTTASLQLIGEVRFADVVSGYRENTPGSEPIRQELTGNRHLLALGSLIREGGTTEVHFHGALGRGQRTVTGCIADEPEAFQGMEVLATVLEETDQE